MVSGFLVSSVPGVTVIAQRHDAGGVEFSIARGAEEQAVDSLIRLLDRGGELWFNDWEQDDGESIVSARRVGPRLEMMSGGHGYSSEWSPADVRDVRATFLRLVRFSHAQGYETHGYFRSGGWGLAGGSGFDAHR